MKVNDFVSILEQTAKLKTLYVKGGIGYPLNAKGKKRAEDAYAYNRQKARKAKIDAADGNTFAFDCCGVIKSILWGFCGDPSKTYGGAVYQSNGVPDLNESGLLKECTGVSTNFNNVVKGEYLYMSGHCGIYIGGGKVVECTPILEDGVQITELSMRKWLKHGKLKYVDYGTIIKVVPPVAKPTLRLTSKGMQVYYLQQDLNYLGAKIDVDGIFGAKTAKALIDFQKKYKIGVDAIYGPESYNKMREVLK